MEPGSIAHREMRIDYAPSPIGGQGQLTRADDQFRVYHSFNSQPFPRILASLSRPLEPLQHAYKICNTLAQVPASPRSNALLMMRHEARHDSPISRLVQPCFINALNSKWVSSARWAKWL